MDQLCEDLKGNTQRIVAIWLQGAAAEPWVLLPEHDRVDFLPEVLIRMADCTLCGAPNQEGLERLAEGALIHGEHRAALGVPDTVIFAEYDLLRRAVWAYFRERGSVSKTAQIAILRFDAAVSLATRSSLLGYHRRQVERLGEWDRVIERVIEESAFGFEMAESTANAARSAAHPTSRRN